MKIISEIALSWAIGTIILICTLFAMIFFTSIWKKLSPNYDFLSFIFLLFWIFILPITIGYIVKYKHEKDKIR